MRAVLGGFVDGELDDLLRLGIESSAGVALSSSNSFGILISAQA